MGGRRIQTAPPGYKDFLIMKHFVVFSFGALLAAAVCAADPYIGFVYPAGGRQGSTFRVVFGGQFIHGTGQVAFSGEGITAKIVEYNKSIGPQTLRLLREQREEIQYIKEEKRTEEQKLMLQRLDKIIGDYVQEAACSAIANILICDITIAADAKPGEREVRLVAAQGLTNPMPFFVGQLPEFAGAPLPTSPKPILGKEEQALRKRQAPSQGKGGKKSSGAMMISDAMMSEDAMMSGMEMGESGALSDVDDPVQRIEQPCVVNGQIAAGTVDRFLLSCRAGQDLVVEVKARALVPYLADAVPGWFQPVVRLCDSSGREIAFNDDYMFKPDPVLICKIPRNGDYLLSIYDALYRGREDFVYRMTVGSLPFVTSRFPLGGELGQPARIEIQGVNLTQSHVIPSTHAERERVALLASVGSGKLLSNAFPFALDSLPDLFESEPNNSTGKAQKLQLPVVVNGCINVPGDKDFFQFEGKKGDRIVAEVMARRLDSPLDSAVMILSPSGLCIGYNDDYEDAGSGLNTHHADSWLSVTLPEDGMYTCILSDTQNNGGNAYAYRLRLSAPRPDFEIRLVPSHVEMTGSGGSDTLTAHLIRRDGFTGPVKLTIQEPEGFSLEAKPFGPTQSVVRVTVKTTLDGVKEPVALRIFGEADIGGQVIRREAVAAEDRMQAFLWRHLVPAQEMKAWVKYKAPPKSAESKKAQSAKAPKDAKVAKSK
jgi:hypothetical protein